MARILSLGSSYPSVVSISPLAIANVLDHHIRRPTEQDRVFGTLLGTWEDNKVVIKAAFGVNYQAKKRAEEESFEVTLDQGHHTSMMEMMHRVNPKEVIVGWYATSATLNFFTPLIHNFYANEMRAGPKRPTIHLALDPDTLDYKTYVGIPMGTREKQENACFKPVRCQLSIAEHERPGIDALTSSFSSQLSERTPASSSRAHLFKLLLRISSLLEQVSEYVGAVNNGEREGDEQIARSLWTAVAALDVQGTSEKAFEQGFNAHLADLLMVSFLANAVELQMEISGRLNLLA